LDQKQTGSKGKPISDEKGTLLQESRKLPAGAWVIPFSTFMIKGFMENIPGEIMEASWIDGASVRTV